MRDRYGTFSRCSRPVPSLSLLNILGRMVSIRGYVVGVNDLDLVAATSDAGFDKYEQIFIMGDQESGCITGVFQLRLRIGF